MSSRIHRTVCRELQPDDGRRRLGLIVTSLLLMYSIDSALNTIWRSTRTRPKIYSFAVYWMILTLGPLLAGESGDQLLSAVVALGKRPEQRD
jgi:YihY family inner membrane protein